MAEHLPLLFRDEHLLVVNKPSGLLMHRGWGNDPVTLVDLARELVDGATVHPVQRLDRGASGAVIVALSVEAARALNAAQADGEIEKQYLALVRGRPEGEGVIEHPIPRKEGGPRVPAVTRFACRASAQNDVRTVSIVSAWPRTGRLHQVRRHLKHLGHPLIGDANYGRTELNREFRRSYGLGRLALHAVEIDFTHPHSGERLHLVAPVPEDLTVPLHSIGFAAQAWQGVVRSDD